MNVEVIRFSHGKDDTLGMLYINGKFRAFTLEDEHRETKVAGETRIPEGVYALRLRKEGGFHQRYLVKFPEMHKGMLEVVNVPNFTYVLIHVGNDEADTDGCLLVGETSKSNVKGKGFVGSSVNAYKDIYPELAEAIERGEQVSITYKSI
jgi:hypothetical protein